MGLLNNILKPEPIREKFFAGLGMPANRLHQLFEAVLIAKLFDVCEEFNLSVMPEGKNKDGENNSQVADVLIVDDFSNVVVIIEICSKDTYNEAKNRIKHFFATNPDTMKEAFIFNFSSNTWDYFFNNRKIANNTICKTVNRDLKKIIENSKAYKEYFK